MSKKVFLRTFGCQMNEHDSGRVRDLLTEEGYCLVDVPDKADVILFNTCSVRKHAEDRVYGRLEALEALKKGKENLIIGIMGCMAEAQRDLIFRKIPYVDFLCGPAKLDKIPEIIGKIKSGAGHIMYLEGYKSKRLPEFSKERHAGKNVYVKIMEGCNNFCSYCVVPYVRGRERSRPSKEILEEIKLLIDRGAERITLLGQNVNSYGKTLKEKINFVGLLRKIDKLVSGKPEIEFITSHPKDANIELFKAMRDLKSISKNLHLPMQSGSDDILKRMNRGYAIEKYKKLVTDFRKTVKGAIITTDIIVGFPGETKKDFEDTLKAVREIRFDGAYIFKYSPRPFTKARKLKDDVPKEEKERRHHLLLEEQKSISLKKQQNQSRPSVFFLVGPTASGKTALSFKLAEKLNAEIISCDSMCVYRGMDIITSKPSKADRKKVRHHLIDITSPAEEFSVAEYRRLALDAIEDILKRGKTPLFVGGSGLYVKAVVDGLFPSGKKDLRFRKKQEALAKEYGSAHLHNKLKKIDPLSARKIHPNNLRRVIRALEIYHTEKRIPSELKKTTEPLRYDFKIFGLRADREGLYDNIAERVEEMFKQGIVEEVKRLSKKPLSVTAKNALGYNEILGYLKGEYSLGDAKELLKKNTRHFAKRQMTWFRPDRRISWFSPAQIADKLDGKSDNRNS